MERIFPDADFMDRMLPKAKDFVFRGILPELVGRFYSRTEPNVVTIQEEDEEKFCDCKQGEFGDMVTSDHEGCPYKWFHLSSLKLKSLPKARVWYCPDCQKSLKAKNSKRQKGVKRQE